MELPATEKEEIKKQQKMRKKFRGCKGLGPDSFSVAKVL